MYTIANIMLIIGTTAFLALAGIGVFFFLATRGTLLYRKVLRFAPSPTAHIYPAYSEMWLIKLIDVQPLISAILLFQYPNLVDDIVAHIGKTSLRDKRALITSCAFGNVIPRIVDVCNERNIERIIITDIVRNELDRVKGKLTGRTDHIHFMEDNAIAMKQESESVDINVLFFLLHELPQHLQGAALKEAGRVLTSGGKLVLAEFHRPDAFLMRMLSRIYFFVFEPHAFALWGDQDPVQCLETTGAWTCERKTYFFGNYQVIIATKA